jgi:hypothetical protein
MQSIFDEANKTIVSIQSSFVLDLSLLHGLDFTDDTNNDDEEDITSKRALQSIIPLSPQHDIDKL